MKLGKDTCLNQSNHLGEGYQHQSGAGKKAGDKWHSVLVKFAYPYMQATGCIWNSLDVACTERGDASIANTPSFGTGSKACHPLSIHHAPR